MVKTHHGLQGGGSDTISRPNNARRVSSSRRGLPCKQLSPVANVREGQGVGLVACQSINSSTANSPRQTRQCSLLGTRDYKSMSTEYHRTEILNDTISSTSNGYWDFLVNVYFCNELVLFLILILNGVVYGPVFCPSFGHHPGSLMDLKHVDCVHQFWLDSVCPFQQPSMSQTRVTFL